MINLENMIRQHNSIMEEVKFIDEEVKKQKDKINVAETVLHINRLAGKLKAHLIEEDRFLYPDLLQCKDKEIKLMAQQYIDEMGDLAESYTNYKTAFHISTKIKSEIDLFIMETKKILSALKKRMEKEDSQLYRIIAERKL